MTDNKFRGVIGRTFFSNPDSPFTTGKINLEDGTTASFAGACFLRVGDKVELTAEWVKHPKYGMQLQVLGARIEMDESVDGLIGMIAGAKEFKGFGPARAEALVKAAQKICKDGDILKTIIERTAAVTFHSNVDAEIVAKAAEILKAGEQRYRTIASLVEMGWSNAQGQTIEATLGDTAPSLVRGDPYFLIGKVARFGFRTVDAVALKSGIKTSDPKRLMAGLCFCLDRIGNDGHTWTTFDALIEQANQELRPDTLDAEALIGEAFDRLIDGEIITESTTPAGAKIVAETRTLLREIMVFENLMAWIDEDADRPMVVPTGMPEVQKLNGDQRKALDGVLTKRLTVITGGAGVGKTYTMRSVVDVASRNGLCVKLAAPTGKAAKRLREATGRDASTLHRLLEPQMTPTGFKFTRNRGNPIEADLVIIDEVSMIDVWLMSYVIEALPEGCRLLLVGDHNQIPSVGAGAVLRDLLGVAPKYPESIHILTDIVRQAGDLARNTSAILDGVVVPDCPPVWSITKTESGSDSGAANTVAQIVEWAATNTIDAFDEPLDFAWEIQVLSPMKKGPLGTFLLNVELQKVRQRMLGNPPPPVTEKDKKPTPLVGDRIIWTKNDYELGLLNGTQALVRQIKKGGAMEITTDDGREVTVEAAKKIHVEVAYAMTIHKSQGSEWPMVVLCASSAHWVMHDRNLLYTGASRASTALFIVGDQKGLRNFASQKKSIRRQTFGSLMVHGWSPILKGETEPLRLVD